MKLFSNFVAKQKTAAILLVLVIGLFVLEQVGAMGILQSPLQKALLPAQVAAYKTRQSLENFFGAISEIGSLRKKENELAYQNALLAAENARLMKLEAENKVLREQIGAKQKEEELILAAVAGADPLFPSSKILVNKGKNDGVSLGALVILKDILVGQVASVGGQSASVRLLSDPETKIPAVTQGGVKGIIRGEFGNRIVLDKVGQGEKLNAGEIVFSSGEADFPKGLVLGKITEIKNDPAALFQKATLQPPIPFNLLEIVFIIKETKL